MFPCSNVACYEFLAVKNGPKCDLDFVDMLVQQVSPPNNLAQVAVYILRNVEKRPNVTSCFEDLFAVKALVPP